ncbi:hypothetical protein SASPL_154074 [Salvia splendens]|uniref:HAUS augmin-like complex subunit 2 n=1 Tax=Salvia splendens TaxID=180675 RepID=A0A8X8YYY7_SALSN|nr:hypothetical protein SASPL_154074 [Salvia splendens]
MSMGGDTTWVGKKPLRRVGGMSDALSIAADLGFTVAPPPSQVVGTAIFAIARSSSALALKKFSCSISCCGNVGDAEFVFDLDLFFDQEEIQNLSDAKGDDLIRILRELTAVQRKIADLQVELQGRKEDKNVAHLTHVSEMEKKIETLARITSILKDVIQNKKQFSELLMKAASDYGALTASVADFQWSQNFKEPPTVWGEMLRPIPVALASCTRFFEAMTAMRESFAKLQTLRVGHSSQRAMGESECVTPPPWRNESSFDDLAVGSLRRPGSEQQEGDDASREASDLNYVDAASNRRL